MELTREVLEGLRINRDEWKTRACQEELRADALEIERDRYREALEGIVGFDPVVALGSPREYMTRMVWIADAALEPVQMEAAHAEAGQ